MVFKGASGESRFQHTHLMLGVWGPHINLELGGGPSPSVASQA